MNTNHKCNACDKIIRKSQHLERHVEVKHEDKECTYCGKLFTSKQVLVKHHKECVDLGIRTAKCNKCENIFTNFALEKDNDHCQCHNFEIDFPQIGHKKLS